MLNITGPTWGMWLWTNAAVVLLFCIELLLLWVWKEMRWEEREKVSPQKPIKPQSSLHHTTHEKLPIFSVRLCARSEICTAGAKPKAPKIIEKCTLCSYSLCLLRRGFEDVMQWHVGWSRGSLLTSGWIGRRVKVKEERNEELGGRGTGTEAGRAKHIC